MDINDEEISKLILGLISNKTEYLNKFFSLDNESKATILKNCDLETKLKFLNNIDDDTLRKDIMRNVSEQEIILFISKNLSDNREDVQAKVADIIRYSFLENTRKITFIKAIIKDKTVKRELLSSFEPSIVLKTYFNIRYNEIPIAKIEDVNNEYDVYHQQGVHIAVDDKFDFNADENEELVNKIRQMDNVTLQFVRMTYSKYLELQRKFENDSVNINSEYLYLEERDLTNEEINALQGKTKFISRQAGRPFIEISKYIKAKELFNDLFSDVTDERFLSIKSDFEAILASDKVGDILIEAKSLLESVNFSEDEQRIYGSRLLEELYKRVKLNEKYLALDEDSVTVLNDWDVDKKILISDFDNIARESTGAGRKKAISLAFDSGMLSEEKAAMYIIDGLVERNMSKEAKRFGGKILQELMKSQNLKISDIEVMDPGAYSDVLAVGNYVVKFGDARETPEVPEDDRILEPLLKFDISVGENAAGGPILSFIEVQPRVIPLDKIEDMSKEEKEQHLYSIYRELRSKNIMWGDAASRNAGVLDFSLMHNEDILADVRNELEGKSNVTLYRSKIMYPKKGESQRIVILDSDYIYDVSGIDNSLSRTDDVTSQIIRVSSPLSAKFEDEYKREQTKRRMQEIQKRKKARRDKGAYGE